MNWAWGLPLRPSVKFVLLALADASDDTGTCWPSIPTLATKTGLDPRSVRRILNHLKANGFLRIERRHRRDGSATSNGYRLAMDSRPGKLSPPPDTVPPPPDTGVTTPGHGAPLTIIEPPREPTPPQPPPTATASTADKPLAKGGTDRGGGGGCGKLIFPKGLSTREVHLATDKLAPLPSLLAQDILDELAGRLNAHSIRGSPLSYLRALIARAQAGTFTPEAGVWVAQARERQRASKPRSDPAPRASPWVTDPETHLARIRQTLTSESQCSTESGLPRNLNPTGR